MTSIAYLVLYSDIIIVAIEIVIDRLIFKIVI